MKCINCNIELNIKKGAVKYYTKTLGEVSVPDLNYYECSSCKDKIFTPEESDKAINYLKDKENQLIGRFPIDQFISANEASKILGISRPVVTPRTSSMEAAIARPIMLLRDRRALSNRLGSGTSR